MTPPRTASGEATTNLPVVTSKLDCRSSTSTQGTNRSQRRPRFRVSLLEARQSSCT